MFTSADNDYYYVWITSIFPIEIVCYETFTQNSGY